MSDLSIRNDFVNGVNEIFTTLFNDGVTDGLNLYLLSTDTKPNIYGEQKYKTYKTPIMMTCKAQLTPVQGNQIVEEVKDKATFTVPLKAFQDNNLGVTNDDLDTYRKAIIEFHGVFYVIDNISPNAYIEDVHLMYRFDCTEDKHTKELTIEEPKEEEEIDE